MKFFKFWKEVRMERNDPNKFKRVYSTTLVEKDPQLKLANLRKAWQLKACVRNVN